MKTVFVSTMLGVSMLASFANAQSVSFGGDVSATYILSDIGSSPDNRYQLNGALVADFGTFGLQLDYGAQDYDDGFGFNNTSFAAHAYYTANPALTVGAYYGTDVFNGGSSYFDSYGIEAKYAPGGADGRFEIEAFVGWYEQRGSDYGANLIGLTGSYAVTGNIDLFAGYMFGNWGNVGSRTDQYDVAQLGAVYTMDSGLYISAAASSIIDSGGSYESVQLQIGYQFGGGRVFSSRSYFTQYPGD